MSNIILRKATEDEFNKWKEDSVIGYADELLKQDIFLQKVKL